MAPGSRTVALGLLAVLTLGVGLGSAKRLSYHEALVAQGAREMLGPGGDWRVPTIGGLPWLEKPPLAHWFVAAGGLGFGGINETVARLPSAVAAAALALILAAWSARRFGPTVGALSGAVQLTTAWSITRGRLADVDMPLAALVAAALIAFDRLRRSGSRRDAWVFAGLIGATAWAKGIGFGAALASSAMLALLAWDRDRRTLRALIHPGAWAAAALIALAWPLWIIRQYPDVIELWVNHVSDRFSERPERFAGESLGAFFVSPLLSILPWTPWALWGACGSFRRAAAERGGPDRLLIAWALAPTALLACASVRNDHYLIHALPPWSVWGALGLVRFGERLRRRRGWAARRVTRAAFGTFGVIGLGVAAVHLTLVPRLDDRGREWAWYAEASTAIPPDDRLILLYDWDSADPWDRLPYPTPFGPIPHDLAVRLFYLDVKRPAAWLSGPNRLNAEPPFSVIARDRDRPALKRLGRVEPRSQGPDHRWDRTYTLYRVTPHRAGIASRNPLDRPTSQ